MKGSYRKQGEDSWEIRFSLQKNQQTGKYDYYRETFHGTETECKDRMETLAAEFKLNGKPVNMNMTVSQFLDYWCKEYVIPELKVTTQTWYKQLIDTHIKPYIGKIKLGDLTSLHIQQFYNKRRPIIGNYNTKDVHICLSSAFNRGYKWRMLKNKFMDQVEPIPRKERKMMRQTASRVVWTADQAISFLNYARMNWERQYYIYFIALTTGLRLGENVGLKWGRIDLKKREIIVDHQVQSIDGEYVENVKGGLGGIYIFDLLLKELEEYKSLQGKDREDHPKEYSKAGWVHADELGNLLMKPLSVSHRFPKDLDKFNKFRRKNELPENPVITFHDLRHSCATLLHEHFKVPLEVVCEILRQSDPSFTRKQYTHPTVSIQKEALNNFNTLFDAAK